MFDFTYLSSLVLSLNFLINLLDLMSLNILVAGSLTYTLRELDTIITRNM
jgi:hypothetical protein